MGPLSLRFILSRLFTVGRAVAAITVGFACVSAAAQPVPADRLGRYDFAYQVDAPMALRPLQLFDDGQRTYVQFPSATGAPAVFRWGSAGLEWVPMDRHGGLVVLEGVAGEYLFRQGPLTGRARYLGGGRPTSDARQDGVHRSTQAQWRSLGSTAPTSSPPTLVHPWAETSHTYAVPVKGDTVAWQGTSSDASVADFGIRASASALPTTPVAQRWTLRRSDRQVSAVLARWAEGAGWTVVWRATQDVDIRADAELLYASFTQAAGALLLQAQSLGYGFKATAYSNQVLLVTDE